ncbi:ketopantoate reductase family protein [Caldalkalibacillus mannanilyticus]|uniref:ketopantoate reductase family protein n=1 Tax=Caldalkalibacillus mannanilyticus TaxID=1418 RepID=UPI00046AC06D|nr:2-dehydropantoate 2-reductase [Caldalkalibacillus mannanilyticus]
MKVLIIGAGALGLLYGSYTKMADRLHDVCFLTRTEKQAEQLRRQGLCYKTGKNEFLLTVDSASYERSIDLKNDPFSSVDLVLITVKQTHLEAILPWIKTHLSSVVPLLFIMNGLGHAEKVQNALPEYSHFFGVTQKGATRLSTTSVEERGRGKTRVGCLPGLDKPSSHSYLVLEKWLKELQKGSIDINLSPEIEFEMWKKCILNACINPLTGLFGIENGKLVEEMHLNNMMRELHDELAGLLAIIRPSFAEKMFDNGMCWEEIERVCRITSQNRSSMEQDIRYGRQTEIDAFNGYFLQEARIRNIHLPAHQFVYSAIQFLQNKQKG